MINSEYITDNSGLSRLCDNLMQCDTIGLDTEFIRTNTYYPKLALIQLSITNDYYVIDPLTINEWQPFINVLTSVTITKVLHSPMEDLEVFYCHLNCYPVNVVDTQVAANCLLELPHPQIGYANLVELVFNEMLNKSETRSDWLQRPLSDMQLQYAINDVIWLLPLYQHFQTLTEEIAETSPETANKLWQQVINNSEQLLQKVQQPRVHDNLYKRVNNHKKLSKQQLALLQRMCVWREQIAQQYDKPKSWIIHDKYLYKLIKIIDKQSLNVSYLHQLEGYSKASIRRYGQQVIDKLVEFHQQNNHI